MAEVTLFAAANLAYFYEHGFAFAKSAVDAGNYVHIIVWKDNNTTWEEEQRGFFSYMENFHQNVDPKKCVVQLLSHNTIFEFKKNLTIFEDRALYACIRFLMLESVVKSEYEENQRNVMVLDIDSIVNKKIEISDDYDIGVFLRHDEVQGTAYEVQGMKVAAGMLYVTPRAMDFINQIRCGIAANPIKWFCDQHALYRAYESYKDELNVLQFDKASLDWEFEADTLVWTGKGRRKYDNETYTSKKKEIELGLL